MALQGWESPILIELGGALALFAAFVAHERHSRQPMLPLQPFRIPTFTGTQRGVFAISGAVDAA